MQTRNQLTKKPSREIIVGLVISLILPLIALLGFQPYLSSEVIAEHLQTIVGLVFMWLITALLIIHILAKEQRTLKSIGIRSITLKQILVAIGLGVLLSILIPIMYTLAAFLLEDTAPSLEQVSQKPRLIIIMGIITAAITEEILMRGYPLERLREISGNNIPGIILSITAFCLLHTTSWDVVHILGVVFPLGLVLTAIYLKTRNLIFAMVVHFFINLPLVFL